MFSINTHTHTVLFLLWLIYVMVCSTVDPNNKCSAADRGFLQAVASGGRSCTWKHAHHNAQSQTASAEAAASFSSAATAADDTVSSSATPHFPWGQSSRGQSGLPAPSVSLLPPSRSSRWLWGAAPSVCYKYWTSNDLSAAESELEMNVFKPLWSTSRGYDFWIEDAVVLR